MTSPVFALESKAENNNNFNKGDNFEIEFRILLKLRNSDLPHSSQKIKARGIQLLSYNKSSVPNLRDSF